MTGDMKPFTKEEIDKAKTEAQNLIDSITFDDEHDHLRFKKLWTGSKQYIEISEYEKLQKQNAELKEKLEAENEKMQYAVQKVEALQAEYTLFFKETGLLSSRDKSDSLKQAVKILREAHGEIE